METQPSNTIESKIYLIRGQKVMLDVDLAKLYGVQTKVFKQTVNRNRERFPDDFMFVLSPEEFKILRSQIVTSSWGGQRYLPYAFTEQGVAMLSSVLHSKQAIKVNIEIMRAFVKIRHMLSTHKDLWEKIQDMESKYDDQFKAVFDAIRQIMIEEQKPKRRRGFVTD